MHGRANIILLFSRVELLGGDTEIEKHRIDSLVRGEKYFRQFCLAHELLDLNRFKTITKPDALKAFVRRRKKPAPFVFLHNKN